MVDFFYDGELIASLETNCVFSDAVYELGDNLWNCMLEKAYDEFYEKVIEAEIAKVWDGNEELQKRGMDICESIELEHFEGKGFGNIDKAIEVRVENSRKIDKALEEHLSEDDKELYFELTYKCKQIKSDMMEKFFTSDVCLPYVWTVQNGKVMEWM